MTLKEKVIKFARENPSKTNAEIAAATGAAHSYVKEIKIYMKANNMIVAPPPKVIVHGPAAEDPIKKKIFELFKKKDVQSISDLSDSLDIGITRVGTIIKDLINTGHNFKIDGDTIVLSKVIGRAEDTNLNIIKPDSGWYRFGAIGDNHLGSNYERLDVLERMYQHYKEEGITIVYNTGNWIDGEARFNKHEIHKHGFDNQIKYFIDKYPRIDGIKTYYIGGDDHEGWYTQSAGLDVGKNAELKARMAGREDLVYLGYMEADVVINHPGGGKTKIRVLHPGGGSSYAISYTVQKIVESYQGGEKPDIVLVGHYHKAEYAVVRGVHCVQTACTQDQTSFMRKKRLAAHLGGWIIEFKTDENGAITRFRAEYFPFYDKKYYKQWSYNSQPVDEVTM